MNLTSKTLIFAIAAIAIAIAAAGAVLIGPPPESGVSEQPEEATPSGSETIVVQDPVHERPIDVSVWAPAENDRNELVVISHGFGGDRTSHSDIAEGLATEGYTVAAPTHPDLAGLEAGDPYLDPLTLRPRHLSLTIDELVEQNGGPFQQTSVVGHSLGGYSALRLAGAQPDLDGSLDEYCAETTDELLCNARSQARFATVANNDDDLSDPRVSHLVLLAPGYGPLLGESLEIAADVMIVAAARDDEVSRDQVRQLADQTHALTQTIDGGHFVFLRPCTEVEATAVPDVCEDAVGIDRATIHADLLAEIVAYLDTSGA